MYRNPICERCGFNRANASDDDKWKNVRYYKRFSKILCDECVDKLDGTWNMQIYTDERNRLRVYYPYKQRR